MTLQNFAIDSATANEVAVMEQASLIWALYHNSRTEVNSVLNLAGGGNIDLWTFQPASWAPSFFVWNQGSNYGIVISGTVNFTQFWRQIQGGFAPVNRPELGVLTSDFWYRAYQAVQAAVFPVLPSPGTNSRFFLSGHSLGGAVAHLLSLRIASVYGRANVQLMTFGEPMNTTTPWGGGAMPSPPALEPPIHFRIDGLLDPIPTLPCPGAGICGQWNLSTGFVPTPAALWWHQGQLFYRFDDGSLRASAIAPPENSLITLSLAGIDNHRMGAVLNWTLLNQPAGRSTYTDNLRTIVSNQLQDSNVQPVLDGPGADDIPTVNQINTEFFGSSSGPVQTADLPNLETVSVTGELVTPPTAVVRPLVGVAAMGVRVTMIFGSFAGVKDDGWTEEYVNVNASSLSAVDSDAQELANARAKLLGLGVKLDGLRYELLDATTALPVRNGQAQTVGFLPTTTYTAIIAADGTVTIQTGVNAGQFGNVLQCYWNFGLTRGSSAPYQQVTADFAWANLTFTIYAGGNGGPGSPIYHRTVNIGGNPDSVQEIDIDDPRYPVAANMTVTQRQWAANMIAYQNLLKGGKWGMAALDRTGNNPAIQVSGFQQDPTTFRVTFNAPGANFQTNVGQYRVSRLNLINTQNGTIYKGLNGIWNTSFIDVNNVQSLSAFPNLAGLTIMNPKSSKIRPIKYLLSTFSSYSALMFWGSRKRGGPFFRSHGKAKKAKR